MNKEKLLYEAPTAQTFVVRFEGMICQSNGGLRNIGGEDVIDDTDLWG